MISGFYSPNSVSSISASANAQAKPKNMLLSRLQKEDVNVSQVIRHDKAFLSSRLSISSCQASARLSPLTTAIYKRTDIPNGLKRKASFSDCNESDEYSPKEDPKAWNFSVSKKLRNLFFSAAPFSFAYNPTNFHSE